MAKRSVSESSSSDYEESFEEEMESDMEAPSNEESNQGRVKDSGSDEEEVDPKILKQDGVDF
jgi:hypothetical protein